MVKRSHVFNLRRTMKVSLLHTNLNIQTSLCPSSTAENMHLIFGSISRNTLKCPAQVDLYVASLYTVSIGNQMIISIFVFIPRFLLGVFNSNVATKFVQLRYFLSQNIRENKRHGVSLVKGLGGHVPPPSLNYLP